MPYSEDLNICVANKYNKLMVMNNIRTRTKEGSTLYDLILSQICKKGDTCTKKTDLNKKNSFELKFIINDQDNSSNTLKTVFEDAGDSPLSTTKLDFDRSLFYFTDKQSEIVFNVDQLFDSSSGIQNVKSICLFNLSVYVQSFDEHL